MRQTVRFAVLAALLAARFVTASPDLPDWRVAVTARAKLHMARGVILAEKYRDAPNYYAVKRWEESHLGLALRELVAPTAPSNAPGRHLEAYIDGVDESAQPFWVYIPEKPAPKPGLLVYLHGYSPAIDRLVAPNVPEQLTDLAEQAGAYAVAPYGRGATDYQHLGEWDVLRVIAEMASRYGIDRGKVVLAGVSMGGLGCWCIGARHARRFNAIAVISGRADFYEWHGLGPNDIPSWQRDIIDVQFATRYLPNLTNTSVIAVHGALDEIVTYNQGLFPVRRLAMLGARSARLITLAESGHNVFADAMADAAFTNLIVRGLSERLPRAPADVLTPAFPGEAGSRTMNALLRPFLLVRGGDWYGNGYSEESFNARIREWEAYAHGMPRFKQECALTLPEVSKRNLVIFGEPEYSRVISFLLNRAGVAVRRDAFLYAGKTLKRDDRHGFLIALPNPFNTNFTAVVQCGLPWATGQAHNHRFDRIPDVISYTDAMDRFGYPIADEAGFIDDDGKVRWSPNPTAEAVEDVEWFKGTEGVEGAEGTDEVSTEALD